MSYFWNYVCILQCISFYTSSLNSSGSSEIEKALKNLKDLVNNQSKCDFSQLPFIQEKLENIVLEALHPSQTGETSGDASSANS